MTSPAVFFALSTGRSGTQTLAHVLSQSPGCLCLHEPHPQLVKESARFRSGRLSTAAAAALLRRTRPHPQATSAYGETNNRLALMVPALHAAFPHAQYVWLLRDARDVVASELQRGAYDRTSPLPWRVSKWQRFRPRADRLGLVPAAQWRDWSRLEKLAWQWDWTHRLVRSDLQRLAADRFRQVRLEELPEQLPDLVSWLGLTPVEFVLVRANRRTVAEDEQSGLPARHPNRVRQLADWRSWTAAERAVFERQCGDLMDELYPGWRAADGTWQETPPAAPRSGTVPGQRAVSGQAAVSGEAVLRGELARARVAALEARSELDDLARHPMRLLVLLAAALRRSDRSPS